MNQLEAIAQVENRFKKLNGSLHALKSHFKINEIHGFRLASKKLKALLKQLEPGLKPGEGFRLTKRFKKFYRALGEVRNLQLQQERITARVTETGNPAPAVYLALLESSCKKEIGEAKKIIGDHKDFTKDEKRIIAALKTGFTQPGRRSVEKPDAGALLLLCALKKPDETKMHAFRKTLKNYLYTLDAAGGAKDQNARGWILTQSNAKWVAEWLGKYRDQTTGLDYLKNPFTRSLPETERVFLKETAKKWNIEKHLIRQKIYDTLKNKERTLIPSALRAI